MYIVVINYINILLIATKTSGQNINILLIAIKTSSQNTDQKLIAGNKIIYVIRVLMYMLQIIYVQHNIWWDNTIVG